MRLAAALEKTGLFLEEIKVSHSIFALPFAVGAAFMASGGAPPTALLGKVILAAIAARTAAMSFNRYADARFDALNPRTARRALPSGRLSPAFMAGAAAIASLAFTAVAWWINRLAFLLSPVALAVLLGYSFTKRFTSLSHLVLGAALGLAPLGAWVAVRGELALLPAFLGAAVLFWSGGFDTIYACQDFEFDRRQGLHSLPQRLGIARALIAARLFHLLAIGLLVAAGALAGYGWFYATGVAAMAALLVYEHSIVSARDLSRVNLAFFTLNGLVSLVFVGAVILETVLS
jgi:4-hydroxybenzoate polyprenyltransferase